MTRDRLSRPATVLLAVNAVSAWIGLTISFTLMISGRSEHIDPAKPTILGNVAAGVATPLERLFDWLTYFTVWSNIVVAIVVTMLVLRPALFFRADRTGAVWRALRLDTVLMITITGVVYNLLLSTGGLTGWQFWSNAFQHIITPIVTVLVWIVAGPRGLVTWRVIAGSLVLPLVWAAWALVRGAAIGAYPYPFLDVATKGYASVLSFIVVIVVVAVLLALLMLAVDVGLRRTMGRPATDTLAA